MAIFHRRQAMLLSAMATARGMTVRAGSRVVGGAMTMSASRRNPNAGGAAGAFVVSTMPASPASPWGHPSSHRRNRPTAAFSGSSRASQLFLPAFQSSDAAGTARSSFSTRRYLSSDGNGNDDDDGDGEQTATPTTTTLPNKTGDRNGLIRHEIIADDGHPLRLYSRAPRRGGVDVDDDAAALVQPSRKRERSILLLHGRTWSSQPVFDLRTSDDDSKRQSTLQSLADLGFRVYALDLRGFGETPRDMRAPVRGYTAPRRCVADVKCAIDWIAGMHCGGVDDDAHDRSKEPGGVPGEEGDPTAIDLRPALLGWSQGALVAQMYAQQHGPSTLSDLVLFGSIYDPAVIYPRKPLYDPSGRLISGGPDKPPPPEVANTDVDSLEDFTLPGTICDEAALTFASLALAVDPVKAAWDDLHEFNVLNPALVHVPTLVVYGAQDPYTSWDAQRNLFERLGTEDKSMCVLPGCDHAAHILKARRMFLRGVAGFLLRKDGF